MSFNLHLRKKKEKEPLTSKHGMSIEQALKTRTKLQMYTERQDVVKGLQDQTESGPATDFLKAQFLATQALGEIGDRARISPKAAAAWSKLLALYKNKLEKYGSDTSKGLESMLFGAYANLLNRSVRHEDTSPEVVDITGLLLQGMLSKGKQASEASD